VLEESGTTSALVPWPELRYAKADNASRGAFFV
jgi:hypothetical protein